MRACIHAQKCTAWEQQHRCPSPRHSKLAASAQNAHTSSRSSSAHKGFWHARSACMDTDIA
eukprot:91079-Pelagomonas_calceolata.AAC.8